MPHIDIDDIELEELIEQLREQLDLIEDFDEDRFGLCNRKLFSALLLLSEIIQEHNVYDEGGA